MIHRVFTDTAGRAWMVRWSGDADMTGDDERVAIRPPGLWFTCPALGEKRYLFHPGVDDGELHAMPEARLQQLLDRADVPGLDR